MGVHGYLIQISEGRLMHLDEAKVPELLDRARRDRVDSVELLRAFESEEWRHEPIPALYLEKWWWRLHVFLTSSDPASPEEGDQSSPLARAILGGREIGEASPRGPSRYLWADEVREIASALSLLTRDELLRRYRAPSGRMRSVYDAAMKRDLADDVLDEGTFDRLVGLANLLATYYRIASARGNAMLIDLS